jgi:hypothetical protein
MTQEEIIAMARQAGCIPRRHPEYWEDVQVFATPEVLQAFAKLVAAKEIERIIAENKPEIERCNAYIKELEDALAKQEQDEPVAWMTIDSNGEEYDIWYENPEGQLIEGWTYKPLYTTPQPKQEQGEPVSADDFFKMIADKNPNPFPAQQRTWVGLTDEDIDFQAKKDDHAAYFALGALWAAAVLKEKNT